MDSEAPGNAPIQWCPVCRSPLYRDGSTCDICGTVITRETPSQAESAQSSDGAATDTASTADKVPAGDTWHCGWCGHDNAREHMLCEQCQAVMPQPGKDALLLSESAARVRSALEDIEAVQSRRTRRFLKGLFG